ncbi:MAG: glyceraldehyde 3-phosphate dehydrogenase NAD-binding domain-containing protein [Candidatus Dependentiae bacterium]
MPSAGQAAIAINGFGRIGRTVLRRLLSQQNSPLRVAAINVGPADPAHCAHLFKYDSTMGIWPTDVTYADDILHIGEHQIAIVRETEPSSCNWRAHSIDWIIEASGRFTERAAAAAHLTAGARKVVICAPGKNVDRVIIQGLTDTNYQPKSDHIISLASCTTNCAAPLISVLESCAPIQSGMITSVHAYTNDQRLLDSDHKDLRRARSAATNMIPTKTGAANALTDIFPHLAGKLHALAIRVPTPNVSFIDCSFVLEKEITITAFHEALAKAAEGNLRGILAISETPLVSSDFCGTTASCIIDSALTTIVGNIIKVCAWYDNEYAYAERVHQFLLHNHTNLG